MTWHDQIKAGRTAKQLSQAKLAKIVGVSQALIAKIELKQLESTEHLEALISALGLDAADFPEEAFEKQRFVISTPMGTGKTRGMVAALPQFAKDPAYWAAAAGLVGDVPLYASAEGGEGSLIIERDSIGTVRRPPLLQGVKDGYAIYLVGDSMSPEFEPGDVLMVNPRLPVLANTSCVFYARSEDEPRAMVKRFLSAADEVWRVRQFNPPRDFDLDRREWETRHRIVSKNFR